MGDALSIADFAIGAPLTMAERVGYPLENYRAINRWHADLNSLPAWQKTASLGEMARAA